MKPKQKTFKHFFFVLLSNNRINADLYINSPTMVFVLLISWFWTHLEIKKKIHYLFNLYFVFIWQKLITSEISIIFLQNLKRISAFKFFKCSTNKPLLLSSFKNIHNLLWTLQTIYKHYINHNWLENKTIRILELKITSLQNLIFDKKKWSLYFSLLFKGRTFIKYLADHSNFSTIL